MVSYQEALEIAQKYVKGIDGCVEYVDAWLFSNSNTLEFFSGNRPMCIIKATGEAVDQMYYYEHFSGRLAGPKAKESAVDRWTSDGKGITVTYVPEENKRYIAEMNAQLEAQAKAQK